MDIKNIYVASSWRNDMQPEVVATLRSAAFEVYDFKHPRPGDNGFSWKNVSGMDPEEWGNEQYLEALEHPIAQAGFKSDFDAMRAADACVLVLPCGRSAHLEAGYFAGANKPLFILLGGPLVPELMYLMAQHAHICTSMRELIVKLHS